MSKIPSLLSIIDSRKYTIFMISALVGWLIVSQYYSFRNLEVLLTRDADANIFGHLQLLKNTGENLRKEVDSLTNQIVQSSNQASAQEVVIQEIEKMSLLLGKVDISGQGVIVTIEGNVDVIWLTDIMNDLWNSGAEALSLNGIRLTPNISGLSQVGQQILLSGNLMTPPYIISAISDKTVLKKSLMQPGGFVARLKSANPGVKIKVASEETVMMKKI